MLIPAARGECLSPFDQKLREAAPLMIVVDRVVKLRQGGQRDLLDELTKAKLDLLEK